MFIVQSVLYHSVLFIYFFLRKGGPFCNRSLRFAGYSIRIPDDAIFFFSLSYFNSLFVEDAYFFFLSYFFVTELLCHYFAQFVLRVRMRVVAADGLSGRRNKLIAIKLVWKLEKRISISRRWSRDWMKLHVEVFNASCYIVNGL